MNINTYIGLAAFVLLGSAVGNSIARGDLFGVIVILAASALLFFGTKA